MSINLQQHEKLIVGLLEATSRVQRLRELQKLIDDFDDAIDTAKLDEIPCGLGVWSIQKHERAVAEALDEISDKLIDVICVIEDAQRKAKKDADGWYRELQRKIFCDEGNEA